MIVSPFVALYNGWKAIGDATYLVSTYHDWTNSYVADWERFRYEDVVSDYRHHLMWGLGALFFLGSKWLSYRRLARTTAEYKGPWIYRGRLRDIPGRMLLVATMGFGALALGASVIIYGTTGQYY